MYEETARLTAGCLSGRWQSSPVTVGVEGVQGLDEPDAAQTARIGVEPSGRRIHDGGCHQAVRATATTRHAAQPDVVEEVAVQTPQDCIGANGVRVVNESGQGVAHLDEVIEVGGGLESVPAPFKGVARVVVEGLAELFENTTLHSLDARIVISDEVFTGCSVGSKSNAVLS